MIGVRSATAWDHAITLDPRAVACALGGDVSGCNWDFD